ncbi:glycosyltransferase [Sphingomonas sp. PB4P5]|uniref:glycosyltransferase n=1 Tax=Parasphingomonas puruogangriensis TaxID=3096155 RepID=UPI002FC6C68A
MPIAPDLRHIAVALPAKNEEQDLPACLAALDIAAMHHNGPVTLVVLANDCSDATVSVLRKTRLRYARLRWHAVSMLPGARHAGWARRLAFDAAVATLPHDTDILASTDADTCVAPDWIVRTVAHFDAGCDAVAGRALTRRIDRAALGVAAARRLNLLGRYYTALDWLRADLAPIRDEPWPRHFYEGGASIALTRGLYHRIGGAPTPPVAEDRALFAAVRRAGALVRHPLDVRVFTSSRIEGRAPGGMADAFACWIAQAEDAPLHETYAFPMALDPASAAGRDRLSFATLPAAIATAGAMIRARRSAAAPQVEPILVPAILERDRDGSPEQDAELADRRVA